jgi:hypothetical protein
MFLWWWWDGLDKAIGDYRYPISNAFQTIDNERINKKNMSTNNTTYLGKKMEDKSSSLFYT